jgi:hypothetical protein|tara:strand:- start:2528 stop:2722 length:195 start_codon:yes stop_codon:yes gene_type:complete
MVYFIPRQATRINPTRFFTDVPQTNIQSIRTGARQTRLEVDRLGGTGKVYPWSQLTDQLSRSRF